MRADVTATKMPFPLLTNQKSVSDLVSKREEGKSAYIQSILANFSWKVLAGRFTFMKTATRTKAIAEMGRFM
jgi:hypothetical protein